MRKLTLLAAVVHIPSLSNPSLTEDSTTTTTTTTLHTHTHMHSQSQAHIHMHLHTLSPPPAPLPQAYHVFFRHIFTLLPNITGTWLNEEEEEDKTKQKRKQKKKEKKKKSCKVIPSNISFLWNLETKAILVPGLLPICMKEGMKRILLALAPAIVRADSAASGHHRSCVG